MILYLLRVWSKGGEFPSTYFSLQQLKRRVIMIKTKILGNVISIYRLLTRYFVKYSQGVFEEREYKEVRKIKEDQTVT